MKKVGILGGTFNPPHLGHLLIANEVRHTLELDEVRLMPTATPPHKTALWRCDSTATTPYGGTCCSGYRRTYCYFV